MTVEERFERMERTHAEHVEMARQDRAAHIAWKREMESQVQATWLAIERAGQRIDRMAEENEKGMAEMRAGMAARDKIMDKRIGDLVGAISELIQRMDRKP